MIVGTGTNYITEIFTFVGRSLAAAFQWLQDILSAVGLPWQVFSLILIGFSVSGFLVSGVFGMFRSEADTAVRSTMTYSKREFKKGSKKS